MKFTMKKIISFVMIMTMAAGLFVSCKPAKAAASVDLATFNFSKSDGPSTAKDLNDTYGTNADTGYSPTSGKFTTSKIFASLLSPSDKSYKKLEWTGQKSYSVNGKMDYMPVMEASTNNLWGESPYFNIRTSTKGYENITLSFLLGGSKKGPKNFKLQYSTDGKTYTDISNSSMSLTTNKKMFSFSYNLPDAVSNNSIVHLRIIATSTTTIEGGSFKSSISGETAINNVSVKGTAIQTVAKSTPTPAPSNSSTTTDNKSTTSNQTNAGTSASTTLKSLSAPTLSSYKAGSKTIKGKALAKATVTVKVGKKTYTATASKKGSFKVKLSKKLKKGNKIKLYATKTGYKQSSTKKYTVK